MAHWIESVEVPRYPVLRITFDDGLSGDCDMTDLIARDPVFAALKDESYFRTVRIDGNGRALGWNLDDFGREIDLCADATRIRIETQIVEELAARFSSSQAAA